MSSILPGFEYDIFISYRQNDNKRDGWVREFVTALKAELEATLKNPVSIYFDENPHDGLLETHQVNQSLAKKLKCLIFVPIVSQTYCDTSSFAWQHEFLAFIKTASEDRMGMNIELANGNVASRVLPIQIHDLDPEDRVSIEEALGGPLRAIPFIYKSAGVNRPLRIKDSELGDNSNKTNYLNQINKVANALKEIGTALVRQEKVKEPEVVSVPAGQATTAAEVPGTIARWWAEVNQRNVPRAAIAYIVVAWLVVQIVESLSRISHLRSWVLLTTTILIVIGFPVSLVLAWKFERGPTGFILTDSPLAKESPFRPAQKKPFSSNGIIIGLLLLIGVISLSQRYWLPKDKEGTEISIAIIPFQSSSTDENEKHYGVGLASEVRTVLSQSKQFQFISSLQATLQYANSKETPTTIGNDLGVTHILSGFYELSGSNIQVTVELVEAKNGNIIWILPYKGPLTDIFEIQADIASKVLKRFDFSAGKAVPITTTNLPAYAHYFKGLELLNTGWREDIFNNAMKEFESAIQLDSSYLPAWVGLLNATEGMIWEINASDSALYKKARYTIDYIHNHFPTSWQTKLADGIYQYHVLSNYDQGLRLFNEVLEEDPENILANQYAGAIYKRKMEYPKAMERYSKAKDQWPKSATTWSEIGEVLFCMGDYENEARVNQILVELGGTDVGKERTFWSNEENGTVEKIPKEIIAWANEKYKSRYSYSLNLQKRNWKALKTMMDTSYADNGVGKLIVYDALGLIDSCKQVASRYLSNAHIPGNRFNPAEEASALAILGREKQALRLMDSLWYNNYNMVVIKKEDLQMQARQMKTKVEVMAMARDYKGATELLMTINKEYPNLGDYRVFFTNAIFDRIKKEYPPFNKALSELKMPQKLDLEKHVKL